MINLKSSSQAEIGSISAFNWSTTEQIWPYHKTDSGDILYAKQINMGNPAAAGGLKSVAHSIAGFDTYRVFGVLANTDGTDFNLPFNSGNNSLFVGLWANDTNILLRTTDNRTTATVTAYIIYTKA